jgi:serine/threonine protein kinase
MQRDAVIQLIRSMFSAVDTDRDGSLDVFEYMVLGSIVSTFSHYKDLAAECSNPGRVKQMLCWIRSQLTSKDDHGPGMTYPEFRTFCEDKMCMPTAEETWFDKAKTKGKLRMQELCEFLHSKLLPHSAFARSAAPAIRRMARRNTHVIPDKFAVKQQLQPTFINVDPNKVKKLKKLGAGGQCMAFLVQYSGTKCVAKIPKAELGEWARENMVKAAALQKTITSPFVAQILGIHEAPTKELILTEFCPNGSVDSLYNLNSLEDHNPISRPLQWRIAYELAQALLFMHGKGVMHRDIKGANILLTQRYHVKLADFDLATEDQSSNHTVGTPGYMAPEVMLATETGGFYDKSCDVFAFGGVLFELSHNFPPFYIPFQGGNFNAYWESLKQEVMALQRPELNMERVTPPMRDLIIDCWEIEANFRPKMADVVQRLNVMQNEYFTAAQDVQSSALKAPLTQAKSSPRPVAALTPVARSPPKRSWGPT